jgi:hypothetical protein
VNDHEHTGKVRRIHAEIGVNVIELEGDDVDYRDVLAAWLQAVAATTQQKDIDKLAAEARQRAASLQSVVDHTKP